MIKHNEASRHAFPFRTESRVRTDVTNAILTGADLRGVDLRQVRGLTCRQLRSARIDSSTRLPICLRLMCAWHRLTSGIVGRNGDAAETKR